MNTLPKTILQQARCLPEGGVLSPKEFLHLGSRSAVDQAFSRLAKTGKLLRVAPTLRPCPFVQFRLRGSGRCRRMGD